ncbi:MarR family winged helix-turn-helix transcriptional regulator [Paeniglutamicibacter cryotolerans]|uniref:DNA-binding MarR family transcriptional regulator n=1 Tax=Paeniglutamicibacter cryotolerans TaxID=670079 RepID=A0A839QGM8_9MICC|nr:MarR family winged helix-turn-helix transcriptional regulator [Paeniglutamicibacter cryotolerans]MBB2995498.1 DNA-binding MarR family transcriptional regulator [Paeniglutamicibacter cryotolerans]
MAVNDDSATGELVHGIQMLHRTLRHITHTGALTDGLGVAAFGVLNYIHRHEPARAGDIARWLGVGPAAMSRQVADLEACGSLERTTDPDDARAQLLTLTGLGRDRLRAAHAKRTQMMAKLLPDWDDDTTRAAARTITTLESVLREGILALIQREAAAAAEVDAT